MKRIFVLFILLALISACASTDKTQHADQPEWVNGESTHYSHKHYLTGVGSGLSVNDAKDRARADIAKQFEISVNERTSQSQEYTSNQSQGESSSSLKQRVTRDLLSYTSKTVEGIELVEQWYDSEKDFHYALAVLSRQKATQQFRQQITELDKQLKQYINQALALSNHLESARHLNKAIDLYLERQAIQRMLQVVDITGMGIQSKISLAELEKSLAHKIGNIKIHSQLNNSFSDELLPLLNSELKNAGFTITNSKEGADYLAVMTTTIDPLMVKEKWYWLRGTLELKLIDTKNDKTIGVYRWPVKASSTSEARSQQRLIDNIQGILAKELPGKFLE